MASLQKALSSTSLPLPSVESQYGAFTALIARMLGAPPQFLSLAHASPLTRTFFLGAFRVCFRAPYCDLHLLRITPEDRRAALLESSLAHQCPYCVGHAAALGDMLRGPVVEQCTRRGDLDIARTRGDALLKRLVSEVCGFPARLTPETKAAFIEKYGQDGYSQISAMLSFMGWLNFTMSATGMHLEGRLLPFAELSLDEKNIQFNLRESTFDDGEEHMGVAEVTKLRTPVGVVGWALAHVENVVHVLSLMPPTISALLAERRWFEGIPSTANALGAWCMQEVGVLLKAFQRADNVVVKRAMAFGLRLVFVEECSWTGLQKSAFMYVFAVGVGNQTLADDAKALEKGFNGGTAELQDALSVAKSGNAPHDRFSAALKFVYVCASPAERVTESIVDGLLRFVQTHRDIVDLAGMVGFFGFAHRAAVLYPGDE